MSDLLKQWLLLRENHHHGAVFFSAWYKNSDAGDWSKNCSMRSIHKNPSKTVLTRTYAYPLPDFTPGPGVYATSVRDRKAFSILYIRVHRTWRERDHMKRLCLPLYSAVQQPPWTLLLLYLLPATYPYNTRTYPYRSYTLESHARRPGAGHHQTSWLALLRYSHAIIFRSLAVLVP